MNDTHIVVAAVRRATDARSNNALEPGRRGEAGSPHGTVDRNYLENLVLVEAPCENRRRR